MNSEARHPFRADFRVDPEPESFLYMVLSSYCPPRKPTIFRLNKVLECAEYIKWVDNSVYEWQSLQDDDTEYRIVRDPQSTRYHEVCDEIRTVQSCEYGGDEQHHLCESFPS